MAESRDIVRHLMDKYNVDPAKEHWYPKDPKEREEVDKWMDWSKELHLNLEKAVVISTSVPRWVSPSERTTAWQSVSLEPCAGGTSRQWWI